MQLRRTHKEAIRIFRVKWTKYAISLLKSCQITSIMPNRLKLISKFKF